MRRVRCSSLPMLFLCGHSQDESDLSIETYNDAADLGTAVHDAMEHVVADEHVDIALTARRHGVDAKDLAILVSSGRQVWEQLQESFPLPDAEVEVHAFEEGWPFALDGHIDVLSIIGREGRFLDWKTGRDEESDYYAQIAGYAAALVYERHLDVAVGSVAWLRSQSVETFRFTRRDASDFLSKVEAQLRPSARYVIGEHCGHCPRSHSCKALIETSRRDAAIFSELAKVKVDADVSLAEKMMALPPADVVAMLRRAKVLTTFAESLEKGVRRVVAERGPLDSGDGYSLSLVEENGKREVDVAKAWPVLQDHLDETELARCITVHASRVDDEVAARAGRGKGAAAKRVIAAALEEAGAVTRGTVTKLKEVRQPRLIAANGRDSK